MRTIAAAIVLMWLLMADSSPSDAQRYQGLSDEERSRCVADGGSIAILGLSGKEGCVHRMPDAGKRCTDGKRCKAGCYLDGTKPGFRTPKPGAKAVGVCAATDFPYGCGTRVDRGRAGVGICID